MGCMSINFVFSKWCTSFRHLFTKIEDPTPLRVYPFTNVSGRPSHSIILTDTLRSVSLLLLVILVDSLNTFNKSSELRYNENTGHHSFIIKLEYSLINIRLKMKI